MDSPAFSMIQPSALHKTDYLTMNDSYYMKVVDQNP